MKPSEPAMTVRILIADDHPIFRQGLRMLLEAEPGFQVVGEGRDGIEAVRLTRELGPDILLLDVAMPRADGLEALRELSASPTSTRVILLAAAIDRANIVRALQYGARGVVLKESATEVLLKGIRGVMAGQYWVGHEQVSHLVAALRGLMSEVEPEASPQTFGLTEREIEIVAAITAGHVNKYIAEKLMISEKTVKHHLTNIFDKLGVSNRLELALFALHHRLPLTLDAGTGRPAE